MYGTVIGMPSVDGASAVAGSRQIVIELVRGDKSCGVIRMFDGAGVVTHDPILAVEVEGLEGWMRLRAGDVLDVRVQIDA